MKTLNLRKLTRIHRLLLGLAVVSAAFLVTTHPALRWARPHVAALGAALPPQARTGPAAQLTVAAKVCSKQKTDALLAEVRARATKSAPEVPIDCSLTIPRPDVRFGVLFPGTVTITKRLIFEGATASGVTVDCNGATIDGGPGTFNNNPGNPDRVMVEIRSKSYLDPATGDLRWARPQNVTLRNCNIIGAVKVYGETGTEVEANRRPDYVTRVRNNAPRSIVFDHVTITGVGGNNALVYLFSGVSNFQMLNSEIKGDSGKGLSIYLDAESYGNTFRNNRIHATSSVREVMALDGSSHNTIVNNYFSALNHGGIYLYRNCGEKGWIRHSTPSFNTIINNVFPYDKYDGDNPAIFVGSRNGTCCNDDCDKDKGFPFGSSLSNLDHAQFNVVMQNQIFRGVHQLSVSKMIRVGRPEINTPNYIKENDTVAERIERRAGCYVSDGYPDFIRDGGFVNLFHTPNGEPACRSYRLTCNDGVLTRSSDSTCQLSQVNSLDFECEANGNNDGCQKTVSVPQGKRVVGAKAACNLEFGKVSATELNGVPANFVRVLRASDDVSKGSCTVGATSINSLQAVVSLLNRDVFGLNRLSFGCRENDDNGGDCHIKGRLYYR